MDARVWNRWCLALPCPSDVDVARSNFVSFLRLRQVSCSPIRHIRLENGTDTVLQLKPAPLTPGQSWMQGSWILSLRGQTQALLQIGSNLDTFSKLFGRKAGKLRHELQTNLQEVLRGNEGMLRRLGSILPTHDYDIAAFTFRPREEPARDVWEGIFAKSSLLPIAHPGRTLGWQSSFVYTRSRSFSLLPTQPQTYVVLAPLHEAKDQDAIERYEQQIKEGNRPVVLSLCLGLPYNGKLDSGMDTAGLCGFCESRELSNLKAVAQHAQGSSVEFLRQEINDLENCAPPVKEQINRRLAALEGRLQFDRIDEGLFGPVNRSSDIRLGLCLILDGHHKLKAAANLGAGISVLCYGLQGTAMVHESDDDSIPVLFDSGAIFFALTNG